MNNDSIFKLQILPMKFRLGFLLLISTLFFAQGLAQSPQRIGLSAAVNAALQKNDKLKQADERVAQKKASDKEAWGNFLPQVNLSANYTHMDNPLETDLTPIRTLIIGLQAQNNVNFTNLNGVLSGKAPLTDAEKAYYNQLYTAGLNAAIPSFLEILKRQDFKSIATEIVQPLFTGGKILGAKKMASSELHATEFERGNVKNEAIKEAINAYLACALMHDIVAIRTNMLADVSRHRDRAQKLFGEGMIPKYQLLRAEAAQVEAERTLMQDQNTFQLTLLNLKEVTGLEGDIALADSLVFTDVKLEAGISKSRAAQTQPILQLIDQKLLVAEGGYMATRASFLPSIAAFGKYEMLPQYLMKGLEPHWAVGIGLQYNLFNGFKDYEKLESIEHTQRELKFLRHDAGDKINLLIDKAQLQAKSAIDEYKKAEANYTVVDENLRAIEKRYESGMATSLEVDDARLMLEKNEIDKTKALVTYYQSLAELYTAEGNTENFLEVWK
jgi:outer membrane protein TolC